MSGTIRVAGLAALAVAIWFLCRYASEPHTVRGIEAPATEFSAVRAANTLGRILGAERPHPAGTIENANVRARIIREFEQLGIEAKPYRAMGCNYGERYGAIECATVTDLIAEVKKGQGKAIVLLAHYDSVPAGPGAADDESGVASILEAVRAMKARGFPGPHPIIALITDGEEYGLLGAASFLHNPKLKSRVGAVVNVEARGNRGPSLLFQTSDGNAPLIDLYARSAQRYATSSLFVEIYKLLPNDTDLTLFIREGIPSFNYAFSENVAHYHTPRDTRANLSRATLQNQGENLLDTALGLERTDLSALKGANAVYLSILGVMLPRMPQWLAFPLALLLFVALAFASFMAREQRKMRWDQQFLSFAMPVMLVAGCGLVGWGLYLIAQLVSGMPDPTYAYPVTFRIALSFAVAGMTLAVSSIAPAHGLARGAWLWLAGLGIVTAAFLPGLSPYFLIPCLIAAILLLLAARSRNRWLGRFGQIALLMAATLTLIVWLALVAAGETLMGLKLHLLFTIPAALGLVTIVPLLAIEPLHRRVRRVYVSICFFIAVMAAAAAGLLPSYSEAAPQRLNLNYVEDHVGNRAIWTADAGAPLPDSLAAAAKFSGNPQQAYPVAFQKAYIATAGKFRFPAPAATANATSPHRVTITLQGSGKAQQMFLVVPGTAGLRAVRIGDWRFATKPGEFNAGNTIIGCLTPDCRNMAITLDIDQPKPFDLIVGERRFGLPPEGEKLLKARPATAVPSQMGDGTVLISRLRIAG
ncbi:MAG TPA: M20/M25/M40 family metallo-hydrolase [Rhizomicrobium sp.]|nr:M20/M25/M40 family metallo-hydrolase [Rhizomicrobium sp.]